MLATTTSTILANRARRAASENFAPVLLRGISAPDTALINHHGGEIVRRINIHVGIHSCSDAVGKAVAGEQDAIVEQQLI